MYIESNLDPSEETRMDTTESFKNKFLNRFKENKKRRFLWFFAGFVSFILLAGIMLYRHEQWGIKKYNQTSWFALAPPLSNKII
jgi:hypothetical protein